MWRFLKSAFERRVLLFCLYSLFIPHLSIARTLGKTQSPSGQRVQPLQDDASRAFNSQAEDELKTGTALTRRGNFSEAIPHLLAARGKVANEYAASFNLALCYVGTQEYKKAIEILNDLLNDSHEPANDSANIENLLSQAYVGNDQGNEAFAALEKAAVLTPQNEKLYLLVADACSGHSDFALGLRVVDVGLKNLPQSARLHYQRAMFLWQLDQFDRAKAGFELASKFGQGTDMGFISPAHEALLSGNVPDAVKIARDGVSKGFDNPVLLTILGEALVRSGVAPGEPGFTEAQNALEKAVSARPNDATAQIALGQIDLASGQADDAITHLERARQLQPDQPSVYANLARAYQRNGDSQQAQQAFATLEKLNEAQAEKIRSAPGDRKMGYSGGDRLPSPHPE
jgi:predicted Zn-dependent protease